MPRRQTERLRGAVLVTMEEQRMVSPEILKRYPFFGGLALLLSQVLPYLEESHTGLKYGMEKYFPTWEIPDPSESVGLGKDVYKKLFKKDQNFLEVIEMYEMFKKVRELRKEVDTFKRTKMGSIFFVLKNASL